VKRRQRRLGSTWRTVTPVTACPSSADYAAFEQDRGSPVIDVILDLILFVCTMQERWSERRRIVVGAAILASAILFTVIAVQKASG